MVAYFIGWTLDKLEAALTQAQEELAAGQTTIIAGTTGPSGGVNSQSQVQLQIQERIQLILIALNKLDATKYPLSSVRRVHKTRVRIFTGDE